MDQRQEQSQTQDLHTIQKQVSELDMKVDKVLRFLIGNELDKEDTGMIGTQNDHERRLRRIEKIADRAFYFLIGLSFFAGWGVIDLVQKIILKK